MWDGFVLDAWAQSWLKELIIFSIMADAIRGYFGLISSIWRRHVAGASLFIKLWLSSKHRMGHDSLMLCSVISSFICQAALFRSVEPLLVLICVLEAVLALGYPGQACLSAAHSGTPGVFSLGVMLHSALQTWPLGCGRDVSCLNLYFVPSTWLPSRTWSPCVISPCYQCGIS